MDAPEVIERLCKLQEEVQESLDRYDHSADCFCGKGGFWNSPSYGGTFEEGYRNDGFILEFMEEAVREKLNRERGGTMAHETDTDLRLKKLRADIKYATKKVNELQKQHVALTGKRHQW